MRPLVRVVTGAEAAALDAATIATGVPSRALMQRAGAAAAAEITTRFPEQLRRGAFVLAGPGNNGGDGWVIARALAASGVEVNVMAPSGARSPDCVAERSLALDLVRESTAYSGEGVVIDALLGTGSSGAVREPIAGARSQMELAARRQAAIVAIDLPSGLDATTGSDNGAITADLTLTFGTIKRGQLISRGVCGTVVALDIGLVTGGDLPLIDTPWIVDAIPRIAAESHKGSRRKLLFQGGARGIAGAVILGLRAALASGIGMVKARVHASTADAVHAAVPAALIDEWPTAAADADDWPDVLVIGPGLGRGGHARDAVLAALKRFAGPVLLDADALTAFEGDTPGLREAIGERPALLTPHPVECGRLLGLTASAVLDERFEIGARLARETNATVLLKGVPTVVSRPDGRRLVVAEGTPALATGGSGDLLCGIAGTLLAQMADPLAAAACAAFIHGRAARLAGAFVRGTTLEDVLEALPNAWRLRAEPVRYPILAELPAVPAQ